MIILFYFLHPQASLWYLGFYYVLLVQSMQDIKCMEVNNESMLSLLCVSMILGMQTYSFHELLLQAFLTSGVFAFLYFITKGKAIGGADVKFMFCCGSALGGYTSFKIILCSSVLALLFILWKKRENKPLPFIPFLSLGVYIITTFS